VRRRVAPRRPSLPPVLLALLACLAAAAPAARGEPAGAPASLAPPAATAAPGASAEPVAPRPAAAEPPLPPGVSPTRAVLLTPLFPGWGQLYARSSWRAALAFGAETMYWTQLLKNDRKAERWSTMQRSLGPDAATRIDDFYTVRVAEYRERVRDFAWWSLGALLIIALDAYVDANLYGFDQDPVPVPDHWDALPAGAAVAPAPDADFAVVLFRAGF